MYTLHDYSSSYAVKRFVGYIKFINCKSAVSHSSCIVLIAILFAQREFSSIENELKYGIKYPVEIKYVDLLMHLAKAKRGAGCIQN